MESVEYTINGIEMESVEYYGNGSMCAKEITVSGLYHCEKGPAYQTWFMTGQRRMNRYYKRGILHRVDGPAILSWNHDGNLVYVEYYIDDIKYTKAEWNIKTRKYKLQKLAKMK